MEPNVANLWMEDKSENHDKLYRLEISPVEGTNKWNVVAAYGRRGCQMNIKIYADSVPLSVAKEVYKVKLREKMRKGYEFVKEDVMEVGKAIPTRKY